MVTEDTARDLDHARRLVGDRRLSYLGEFLGILTRFALAGHGPVAPRVNQLLNRLHNASIQRPRPTRPKS